jgi:folate-binding Fe-S cluster repair protein YgfZ
VHASTRGPGHRFRRSAAAELAHASEATIVSPLTHLGLIEVAGPDAAAFLHNQLTSDVKHLAERDGAAFGLVLGQGRMLASFLFSARADYRLQLSADLLPAIHKRLQMFVLRSKVRSPTCRALTHSSAWPARKPKRHCSPPACRFPDAAEHCAFARGRRHPPRWQPLRNRRRSRRRSRLWQELQSHARPVGTPSGSGWISRPACR